MKAFLFVEKLDKPIENLSIPGQSSWQCLLSYYLYKSEMYKLFKQNNFARCLIWINIFQCLKKDNRQQLQMSYLIRCIMQEARSRPKTLRQVKTKSLI